MSDNLPDIIKQALRPFMPLIIPQEGEDRLEASESILTPSEGKNKLTPPKPVSN